MSDITYIKSEAPNAFKSFTDAIEPIMKKASLYSSICILCIGTDRLTGDSLGPLIGYKLKDMAEKKVFVYGTLKDPVHAKNLDDTISKISKLHNNAFILAIDACLGLMDHVGYIAVREGPLRPGAGVNKELTSVGHANIMGIVNYSGYMDFLVLQSTRLSIVMDMADIISSGIRYALWKNKQEIKVSPSLARS